MEENADTDVKGTDPGIVFFEKREVPEEIKAFAKKTETDIVTLKEATASNQQVRGRKLWGSTPAEESSVP